MPYIRPTASAADITVCRILLRLLTPGMTAINPNKALMPIRTYIMMSVYFCGMMLRPVTVLNASQEATPKPTAAAIEIMYMTMDGFFLVCFLAIGPPQI